MNGTAVYIVAAAIIVVVVVALLSYWTLRQVRKHEVKRTPGVMTRRQDDDRSATRDDGPQTGTDEAQETFAAGDGRLAEASAGAPDASDAPDPARELRSGDETQGLRVLEADRGLAPASNAEQEWRPEHRPPLVLARSEAEDGIRHLDEDQVVGLSAYETNGGAWDAPESLPGIEPAEDALLEDAPAAHELPAFSSASASLTADEFHALLRRRLQHPAVLGWLVVSADGEFRDGDQVYDDRVLELLTALAVSARETATTVGLTAPREVVVRGAEGVICVVPADQIEAGRTESVVVFVEDGGPSPGEVARSLGAQGGAGLDDATTG